MATQREVKNILYTTFSNAIKKGAEKLPPFLIVGDAGIGKSQIVKQVADELGITLRDRRLSQFPDSGDIVGIPCVTEVNGKKITEHIRPNWLPTEDEDYNILFLDEFNRAISDVRSAAFQLLTEWKINTHNISPKTFLVMAINEDNEDNFVNTLDRATNSRMVHLPMFCETSDWLQWAKGNLNPAVYNFIKQNNGMLYPALPEDISLPFACPRTWEFVSRYMDLGLSKSDHFVSLISGCVGYEAGVSFSEFLKASKEIYNGYRIIDEYYSIQKEMLERNYSISQISATNEDLLEVLSQFANSNVTLSEEQNRNLLEYLRDIPAESAFVFIREVMSPNNSGLALFFSSLIEECSSTKYEWDMFLKNLGSTEWEKKNEI